MKTKDFRASIKSFGGEKALSKGPDVWDLRKLPEREMKGTRENLLI